MKKTQKDWVISELIKKRKVSRNAALAKYITRLGAYIYELKEAGFEITGSYVKTKNGRDYVYFLKK